MVNPIVRWLMKRIQKGDYRDDSTYDIKDKNGEVETSRVIVGVMAVNEDGELEPLGDWQQLQTFNGGICLPLLTRITFFTCGGDLYMFGNGNALQFNSNGTVPFWFSDVALVINESGIDMDTRIEGLSDINLVHVDASTDRVGIGTATPAEKLEVAGNVRCTDLITTDDVIVGDDILMSALGRIYFGTGDSWIGEVFDDRIGITLNNFQLVLFYQAQMVMNSKINMNGNWLDNTGWIKFDEIAKPAAVATHGLLYCKAKGALQALYHLTQDDVEHELAYISPYGAFYGNNIAWVSVAFGGGGTFVIISDANITVGRANNTTFQNNQELLIAVTGDYDIDWDISVEASGANKHIEAGIGVDGVCNVAGRSHMETKTANEEDAFGGGTILALTAAEKISVMITNVDDNTQLEVHHINLKLKLIGG